MRTRLQSTCLLLTALLLPANANANEVRGHWLNEDADASIEIARCGESLCGRIVWLRYPSDAHGNRARDSRNPVPTLRTRPLLGLTILTGHELASGRSAERAEGRIYDPKSGRTYSCKLTVDPDGTLEIRGYVGLPLLGRTTRWTRVAAEDVVAWTADPSTAPPLKPGARCDRP